MKTLNLLLAAGVSAALLASPLAQADVGPKTAKAIDDVNAKLLQCAEVIETMQAALADLKKDATQRIAEQKDIKKFDDNDQNNISFKDRGKQWRTVKNRVKAAIKNYDDTCSGITEDLEKIDKNKNKNMTFD
jgi:hypothetical protein